MYSDVLYMSLLCTYRAHTLDRKTNADIAECVIRKWKMHSPGWTGDLTHDDCLYYFVEFRVDHIVVTSNHYRDIDS